MYQGSRTFSTLLVLLALAVYASGQAVISARAGVVHFFDGAVYLGDRALESHLGKFPTVPPGGELRTEQGRAEVLLTPGVFLRMGEHGAIRMIANDLADTQVELCNGSVMVEAGEPSPDTKVTLTYRSWEVRFTQKGVFRVDTDPPRLWALRGSAEVSGAASGELITVEGGSDLPFADVLVPERSSLQPSDALSEWSKGRGESIVADNAITSQIGEDPANQTAGLDSFTYFPFLGVPSVGLMSPGLYGSALPYQPGFSSIYLPGYTYRPPLLGIIGGGYRTYIPSSPARIGAWPVTRPLPTPLPGLRPSPIHVPPRVGGGIHRR